jgi:hypothetical protein
MHLKKRCERLLADAAIVIRVDNFFTGVSQYRAR